MLSVWIGGLRPSPQRKAEEPADYRPGPGERGPGHRRRRNCLQQQGAAPHLQTARPRPRDAISGSPGRLRGHGAYPYDHSGGCPILPEQPSLFAEGQTASPLPWLITACCTTIRACAAASSCPEPESRPTATWRSRFWSSKVPSRRTA